MDCDTSDLQGSGTSNRVLPRDDRTCALRLNTCFIYREFTPMSARALVLISSNRVLLVTGSDLPPVSRRLAHRKQKRPPSVQAPSVQAPSVQAPSVQAPGEATGHVRLAASHRRQQPAE